MALKFLTVIRWLVLAVCVVHVPGVAPMGEGRDSVTKKTNGAGGLVCDNIVCLDHENVSCKNKRCRCGPEHKRGDGQLLCSNPDEYKCQVFSDPLFIAFSGEDVYVPISCQFLLTVMVLKAKKGTNDVGECLVQITGWGTKGFGRGRRGKHFMGGTSIEMTLMIDGQMYYHSTRLYGHAVNGKYRFREQGNSNPMDSGGWGGPLKTNFSDMDPIGVTYDEGNNIAIFRAGLCGLELGFRPQEAIRARSESPQMAPGIYITVKKDNMPSFLADDSGLCFAPPAKNNTLDSFIDRIEEEFGKRLTKKEAMMYRILRGSTNQAFPGAPARLQAFATEAQECRDDLLICALQHCLFINNHPKFLKCWGSHNMGQRDGNRGGGGGGGRGQRKKRSGNTGNPGNPGNPGNSGGNGNGGGNGTDDDDDDDDDDVIFDQGEMDEALLLMGMCFKSFCDRIPMMCEIVKKTIRDSVCVNKMPDNSTLTIMDFDCNLLNGNGR